MRAYLVLAAVLGMGTAVPADEEKEDLKQLQGCWTVVKAEQAGVAIPPDPSIRHAFTFTADEATHEDGGGRKVTGYKLDPAKKPAHIDLTPKDGPDKGKTFKGIYELKGDMLRLCFAPPDEDRPAAFSSKKDERFMLFELKRDKK
jgi:uncharacterized protein (TIGR03067 family)